MKRDWLQIVSNIAIVLGLVVLVYELQQARTLTYAQLISDAVSDTMSSRAPVSGESPAVTLARACYSPELVTEEDLFVLESVWGNYLTNSERFYFLEQIGQFEIDWRPLVEAAYVEIVVFEHGRKFLEYALDERLGELREIVRQTLSRTDLPTCRDLRDNRYELEDSADA